MSSFPPKIPFSDPSQIIVNQSTHVFLRIAGLGWPAQSAPKYGRLPPDAAADVGEGIFNLSQCSAGVVVKFETDATSLDVNVTRRSMGDGLLSLTGRQDDIMPYVIGGETIWFWRCSVLGSKIHF